MGNNAAREQQQKQYEEDLKRRREEVLARNQGQFKITNQADVKTLQEHDNYFKAPDPVSIGMPEQVDPSKFATDPFGNKQPVFTGTDEEWNKKV